MSTEDEDFAKRWKAGISIERYIAELADQVRRRQQARIGP